MTPKKILLALLLAAGLTLAAGPIADLFRSDESRIRALVARMEAAYNAGKPGTCVGPLAKGWRHEGYSIDREQLLGGLFQASRERDPRTRQLRSRVEVDEDAVRVAVDGARATLGAEACFWRLRAETWEPVWRLSIEAELEDGEDGWKIVRSRHVDLQGTQLGR